MDNVYLLDLINGISETLDYVSTTVSGHHRRVGVASSIMAEALSLDADDTTDLLMAGLLHDIGAFSQGLKFDGLDFEIDLTKHAYLGYRLLHGHPLLARIAEMVRVHHTPWKEVVQNGNGIDKSTLFLGNVINLVDRADVLANVNSRGMKKDAIRKVIGSYSSAIYAPRAVEVFMDVSAEQDFWDRITESSGHIRDVVTAGIKERYTPQDQLLDFSRFFSHLIDFRSRHTATHSQGVAETAVQLARLAGMSELDQKRMRLAGNLHDLGKLAVPGKLLDKPSTLDPKEYEIVQNHAVVCETVLRSIPGLENITDWACQHHERLNGKGYPHALEEKDLSLGSRIMAVSDVYTAISEDRPYRDGMDQEKALFILQSMAVDGFLDHEIVALVVDNYEQIDAIRRIVQSRANAEFKHFSTQ